MQGGALGNSFDPAPMAYSRWKKQRVAQFADYLRLMRWRRKRVGRDCFVVFSEDDPQCSGPLAEKARSQEVIFSTPPSVRLVSGGANLGEDGLFPGMPAEGEEPLPGDLCNLWGLSGGSSQRWQSGPAFDPGGSEPPRFLQFAFLQDRFYLELPKSTLAAAEAQRLLTERHGFYWAREHCDYWWVNADWEAMLKWDPLQKLYLYRDEDSAAEDMAFVLYDVWKFPLDQPWYINAGCFETAESFDTGKSLV